MNFKEGDKVTVLCERFSNSVMLGYNYYITKVDGAMYSLGYKKGEYLDNMWVKEDDIELIKNTKEKSNQTGITIKLIGDANILEDVLKYLDGLDLEWKAI